jgi:hypothetical protein
MQISYSKIFCNNLAKNKNLSALIYVNLLDVLSTAATFGAGLWHIDVPDKMWYFIPSDSGVKIRNIASNAKCSLLRRSDRVETEGINL